ncbi:TRAP transporter large permease [Stappia sp. ES.058]|uniref:TRAP transporter large permease n=1 Tax=Stappia sp. ES.058 TaxID=1881061 RepID=UPI00087DA8A3|nr:TRAP transporter large permease [Stappia sp. ES.058]SDU42981.1 TRAP transporter, DctM subunit [Stappia sp. ES.058]
MVGIAILIALFGLIMLAVPVSFAIPAAALTGFLFAGWDSSYVIVTQQLIDGVSKPALVAIPFFIFTGSVMNRIGLTERIFALALAFVGHFRAGLAHVNVLASLIFAGVSGSATADIAGLGQIEVKAMRARGYSLDFAAALTVATSIVGPIIPPSITLIVYAWLSNTSIARLFLAGLVPGLLVGLAFMVYIRVTAIWTKYPVEPRATFPQITKAAIDGLPAVGAPLIILCSITFGLTTATEAGVLAAVYALLLGVFYRTISFETVWGAALETVNVTAFIMMIIGASTIMSWILTFEQVPQSFASAVLEYVDSRTAFLLVAILIFVVCGFFLEATPSLIILMPLLLPSVDAFGVDRVQFGIVSALALLIGLATPPVGVGLYVMSGMVNISLERLSLAILPLLIPVFVALFLIAFFPQLTLWLPNLLLGG